MKPDFDERNAKSTLPQRSILCSALPYHYIYK